MTKNCFITRSPLLLAAVVGASLFCLNISAVHANDGVNTGYFGSVAILGYDPVAYFSDGKATKGLPEVSQKWLGATWLFSSTKHRDAFASEPTRYAPQYGGFCALGMAIDEASANIDPEAWRIVDGKLYLFSGKEGLEQDFDAAPAGPIAKADAEWPKINTKEFDARRKSN